MALIEVSGLARLYAGDMENMNRKRYCIAAALTVSLGTSCIIGQYSNDRILLFFSDACSKFDIRKRIEDSFSFLRLSLSADNLENLRFVAAAVCDDTHNTNYDIMLEQVLRTCSLWKNTASDLVIFSSEDSDPGWKQIRADTGSDQIRTHPEEMKRPLSDGEKDVVFHCLSAMLSSDSLDTSVRSVLSYVGLYYQADWVYVLTLAENRHVVTMLYGMDRSEKTEHPAGCLRNESGALPYSEALYGGTGSRLSLRGHTASERKICRTPCIRGISPYFLSWRTEISSDFSAWKIREHAADAALFRTLIPYLLREQNRFRSTPILPGELPQSLLTELPNLRSYRNVISSLNQRHIIPWEPFVSIFRICPASTAAWDLNTAADCSGMYQRRSLTSSAIPFCSAHGIPNLWSSVRTPRVRYSQGAASV